jgi:hypothetical protein
MEYFTPKDCVPSEHCINTVARSDIYVGIIGMRYGSLVGDPPHSSFTELEFEAATAEGLPRLVFLVCPDPSCALRNEGSAMLDLRQDAFRRRLQEMSGLTVGRISSPSELELQLLQALAELRIEAMIRYTHGRR